MRSRGPPAWGTGHASSGLESQAWCSRLGQDAGCTAVKKRGAQLCLGLRCGPSVASAQGTSLTRTLVYHGSARIELRYTHTYT